MTDDRDETPPAPGPTPVPPPERTVLTHDALGGVYFIRAIESERVKIGHSTNVHARLTTARR